MRCVVFYNQFSHYRKDLFLELIKDEHCDFSIFYGSNSFDLVEQIGKPQLKNIYFSKYLFWQVGAINIFLNESRNTRFILTGEVNILSNWLICLMSKFNGKKIFFHTHGFTFREGILLKTIRRVFYSMADGLLLYDSYQLKYLKNKYNLNCLSVNNSFNYFELRNIRSSIKWSGNSKNILFIGRIVPNKNLESLITSLSDTDYKLQFIGPGSSEYISTLKGLALNSRLSIEFIGSLYNNMVLLEYANNAICSIFPGNCGLGGLHSIQIGLPVITHYRREIQTPEFNYIVEGLNGFLYEYDSDISLKLCIEKAYDLRKNNSNNSNYLNYWRYIDDNFSVDYQIKVIKSLLYPKFDN